LLSLMFQAADPVNGFQPDWAFHRRYLADPASLGAPIGPSHRIAVRSLGTFSCQHFALDTLCSPVGAWQTVYRLSELGPKAPGLQGRGGELRRVLLDDLYRARSGHRYDPTALLTAHAEEAGCGAPLGRPEVVTAAGRPYLLMPFALDVLACQLPGHDWPIERPLPDGTQVIALSERAATAGLLGAASLARPSLAERVRYRARASQAGCAIALGAPTTQPPVFDLSLGGSARRRALPVPDTILICDAPGPVAHDLRHEAEAGRWHYYLDTAGAIYCLRDERSTAAAAAEPGEEDLVDRAIVIAVEGGPASAGPAQRRALSWLVRLLAAGLQIAPGRVRAFAPARLPAAAGEGSLAHERGM
jgi:hypothetical protein